jgi:hypothetical protein
VKLWGWGRVRPSVLQDSQDTTHFLVESQKTRVGRVKQLDYEAHECTDTAESAADDRGQQQNVILKGSDTGGEVIVHDDRAYAYWLAAMRQWTAVAECALAQAQARGGRGL